MSGWPGISDRKFGDWSNSRGMCSSVCFKGSAEWTANPLIQWDLFLMLGGPRGQGNAPVITLTHVPFSTLQTGLIRLYQPSFHNGTPLPIREFIYFFKSSLSLHRWTPLSLGFCLSPVRTVKILKQWDTLKGVLDKSLPLFLTPQYARNFQDNPNFK